MRRISSLLILLLVFMTIVPGWAQEDEVFELTVLHSNDQHAHHLPDRDGNGGAAIAAAVVNQVRDESDNVLLLDAGDRFTGTLFHYLYKGTDNAEIMNLMGYDAMAVGNHEFDDGPAVFAEFAAMLDFSVVSANIDASGEPDVDAVLEPYTILDVGGRSVGIFGLTTPETDILSSPGEGITFEYDLASVASEMVAVLEEEGVNVIIALTHLSYKEDVALAETVDGIDIIVGGHSHTLLSNELAGAQGPYPTEVTTPNGGTTLVVTAKQHYELLGRLDVEFDAEGMVTDYDGEPIVLIRYITPNAEVAGVIDEFAAEVEELRNTVVGETAIELVGERGICRTQECNMGNMMTDVMRMESGAQIAITNGGGIRASIPAGEVTVSDVITVFPFGNTIATFDMVGADILEALENGVSQVEDVAGRFPQVSGMHYTWDGSKEPGSRIVSVEVWNEETGEYEPLDPEAIYSVATNDYMRGGGDGYGVFAEKAIDPYDEGEPLDQALIAYIAENSPVSPEVEGRITRVDE